MMRTDTSASAPIRLSVLSCAYNEEANISEFLAACLDSKGPNFTLNEVLVVASGCTDRTEEIVRRYQVLDPKVRLLSQPDRRGKVSALMAGLSEVTGDVVLVENSDTVPSPEAFDRISVMFRDPELRLVGAHPVPVADSVGPTYQLSKIMWDLHDSISVNSLKVGEAYAFRAGGHVRFEQCEDDDTLFSVIAHSGRVTSRYARDAIIWTRPPATFEDLWNHRYRIARLIARRRKIEGEGPSTWDPSLLLRAVGKYLHEQPRKISMCLVAFAVEATARLVGRLVVALSSAPLYVWRPILSTKGRISRVSRSGQVGLSAAGPTKTSGQQ
jgi:biofilm PGA synthesis N-glycosyltransferase PgaC